MEIKREYKSIDESKLIIDGEDARKAILDCIDKAKQTIRVRVYMWRDDHMGNLILDALTQKAKAYPDIRIFIEKDAFGSIIYNFQRFISLRKRGGDIFSSYAGRVFRNSFENIHFSYIGSWWPFHLKYLRENDHSKVLLFDEFTMDSTALIGGMNIADEYLTAQSFDHPQDGGWHDYMVRVTRDIADSIAIGNQDDFKKGFMRRMRAGVEILMTIRNRHIMRRRILKALSRATTSIIIEHAYLTDAAIIRRLRRLSYAGVDVQVILPSQSDGAWHANMHSIYKLLRPSGIRHRGKDVIKVSLYPGMIHAKVILIDGSVAIVGSANLTYGSFDILGETNAIFHEKEGVTEELGVQLGKDIARSKRITFDTVPLYKKWLARFQSIFI